MAERGGFGPPFGRPGLLPWACLRWSARTPFRGSNPPIFATRFSMAERGGFEPPVRFAYTRFPSVLLKPLGHLSGAANRTTGRRFPRPPPSFPPERGYTFL